MQAANTLCLIPPIHERLFESFFWFRNSFPKKLCCVRTIFLNNYLLFGKKLLKNILFQKTIIPNRSQNAMTDLNRRAIEHFYNYKQLELISSWKVPLRKHIIHLFYFISLRKTLTETCEAVLPIINKTFIHSKERIEA